MNRAKQPISDTPLSSGGDALLKAVQAAASAAGSTAVADLARAAAELLNAEIAFVAVRDRSDPAFLKTLALSAEGEFLTPRRYALAASPCAAVLDGAFCSLGAGDSVLTHPGLDLGLATRAYAGAPLFEADGKAIGVFALMSTQPVFDPTLTAAVLSIFATRAASQLEQVAEVPASGESEDIYRRTFEASLDGIGLIDRNGNVVDVNPALGKLDGFARDDVIGKYPPRFRDPSRHASYHRLIQRVLDGEAFESEMLLPHKNGGFVAAETRNVRFDYRGEPHMLVIVRDLTEQKRREDELKRSEEAYRTMFDASLDGLVVLNAAGCVVDLNPALLRMDGFIREELLDQFPPSFREPEFHGVHRDYIKAVLEKGSLHSEASLLRKDGSHYIAEMRSVRFEYRGKDHVLVVVRDVSERRQREIELKRREEQYRCVFEGVIDGLALVDSHGLVVDVNQAILDMNGYQRDEVIGKLPPVHVGDPGKVAGYREYIRRVLDREPVKGEYSFARRDGGTYFAEIRAIRINHDGEPHVLLLVRDISEQKLHDAALAQSEDRLRATVATALDCIVAMNEAGEIIDFNPAAEECFGYTHDEVIGRALDEVLIPPHHRDKHRAGLNRYLSTGEGPYLGTRIEVEAMRKDGSVIQTELAINVAQGTTGRIFVGYLRDITAQKRAAEQSEVLEAQLRQAQKMEAIGHLTGGVAHDFNNILTSILGYVTLARDYVEDRRDDKLDRYLERAERAGERARDLIGQMLTFSKGQTGERRQVELVPLVQEALSLLESSLPASIEMTTKLPIELPTINIDPVHFEQILVNLCINARDAMDGIGGINVCLREHLITGIVCAGCQDSIDGHFVELAVADTGPGIDPNIVTRIFEPFFTTKDIGKGTGMGLSTVHGIVHDHSGHTLVDTAPGAGTTMRIFLPIAAGETAAPGNTDARTPRADDNRLAGRVLVVDDNSDVGEYLEDLLDSWGMTVTVFNESTAARNHITADPAAYDLIITDQTMPRLTGLELAGYVAEAAPDVPVFLYTGYSEGVTEEVALRAGVRAFLKKPLDTAALHGAIREVLG